MNRRRVHLLRRRNVTDALALPDRRAASILAG